MTSGNCGAMTKEAFRRFLDKNDITQEEAARMFANEVGRSGRRWALENGPPFAVALLIATIKHYELDVYEIEHISRRMRNKFNVEL